MDSVFSLLAERYGERGAEAAGRLREWLSGDVPHSSPETIERLLGEENVDLLFDSFWQIVPFGTGGRRGNVGYGSNRINPATVAITVQGHCDYLRAAGGKGGALQVVVANDVRVFNDVVGVYRALGDHPLLGVSSRSLGRLACEIYAGNGITAYFARPTEDDAVLTTPELSYLIWKLGAGGGINLSASHNPPDDNGIKVYDRFGSQPVAPDDQELADRMEEVREVRSVPFAEALERGLVRAVPEEAHRDYVRTYVELFDAASTPDPAVPIVYTPLCGCGDTTAGEVLRTLGFPVRVPPDQGIDGSFAAIPLRAPNPEVPQATGPAREFAEANGASIVISSDPDADRVGLDVRLADGSWQHFDGNRIATILCYYLMLDPRGPRKRGLVIETLVTTKALGAIVERAGGSWIVDDLLVGFKYIADVLKELDEKGRRGEVVCSSSDLVIACEESHGIMMIPTIRDKDATPACMFLAALHQRLAGEGMNLRDYFISILEDIGGFDCVNRSIMLSGAEGMQKKNAIMASLRTSPPETIGGRPVEHTVDYFDDRADGPHGPFVSETEKLPRNVIQLITDQFSITIRPSGTEAKLKIYCQLQQNAAEARGEKLLGALRERARGVVDRVYNELLARVGHSLGETGLLLPDIIDLGRKESFEGQTVGRIHDALTGGRFDSLDAFLDWLRGETALLIPGSDARPAIKAALSCLVQRWSDELGSLAYLGELKAWLSS